jgi:hypothetical protein
VYTRYILLGSIEKEKKRGGRRADLKEGRAWISFKTSKAKAAARGECRQRKGKIEIERSG